MRAVTNFWAYLADMDETALAVLARVSVVADKLKRGDFAN